ESTYSRLDCLEYLLGTCAPTPTLFQQSMANASSQVDQLADANLLMEISWLRAQLTVHYAKPDHIVPFLTWQAAAALIEGAYATRDYAPLLHAVVPVFSSARSLSRSFLLPRPRVSLKSSGLDMAKVRLFYAALKALPRSVLEAVTAASIALLDGLNHVHTGPFFDPEQLRFLLVLLENPLLQEPRYHQEFLAKLCCELVVVERQLSQYLLGWFCRAFTPASFRRVVLTIQEYITMRLYSDVDVYHDWSVISGIKVLGYFNMANNLSQFVPFNTFYNLAINESLSVDRDFKYWVQSSSGFCFCQYPYVLNIANKNSILKQEALAQMSQEVRDAVKSMLRGVRSSPYLKLSVTRDRLVQDTLQQLQSRRHELKKQLRVHFNGEEAVDAGGVTKEFFQLIVRDIFHPKYGMFLHLDEPNVFWFNGCASTLQDTTQEFQMIGTIIGLAIYNGVILDLRLPFVVYKKLLGLSSCFDDLRQLDPALHRGLQQLLDLTDATDIQDLYDTSFEAPRVEFGRVVTHELKPGGKDIPLTIDNRQEYVDLYTAWLLTRSIEVEFTAFRNGFLAVCGGNALSLLKPDELELLICGNPSLDTHKLQKCAKYRTGYSEESPTIQNFWKLFHAWPLEKQKKLLFFITGSDRIPFEGVSELVLVIDRPIDFHGGVSQLPVAHACFNQLVLPDYANIQILDEKLSIAIENSEGFGLR
ncbi:MAG: HECT domain-containing protein, partial [archaeon]|nr:HECT domain-containing protein [archaeon]